MTSFRPTNQIISFFVSRHEEDRIESLSITKIGHNMLVLTYVSIYLNSVYFSCSYLRFGRKFLSHIHCFWGCTWFHTIARLTESWAEATVQLFSNNFWMSELRLHFFGRYIRHEPLNIVNSVNDNFFIFFATRFQRRIVQARNLFR